MTNSGVSIGLTICDRARGVGDQESGPHVIEWTDNALHGCACRNLSGRTRGIDVGLPFADRRGVLWCRLLHFCAARRSSNPVPTNASLTLPPTFSFVFYLFYSSSLLFLFLFLFLLLSCCRSFAVIILNGFWPPSFCFVPQVCAICDGSVLKE